MPKARTTLSLDAVTIERWQRLARLQRTSLSAVVNEWLDDTYEAAEYKAVRIYSGGDDVRQRVAELTTALAVVSEGYQAVNRAKEGRASGMRSARPDALSPPSCNTGGKLPKGVGVGS